MLPSPLLLASLGGLICVVLVLAAYQTAKQYEALYNSAQRDVSRLQASVASLIHDRDRWIGRALTAEQRVEELFLEHCEDRARTERSWEIISERCKAIDDARAKCGPDLPPEVIVGTERDPVFLSRPNADHDDFAWVSTIDELTKGGAA